MDIQMPIISMENSIELKAEENMITRGVSMFLRGIGTLLVILAHYSQWYVMVEGSNIIWYLLTKLGRYGVAVFFLVSGYGLVFSAKKGVTTEWIIRRVMHVYFPYLVIEGILHLLGGKQWTLRGFTGYIFCLDAWFVFVIVLFYIAFWFVWRFCTHKMLWMAIGILAISFGLALVMKDSVWYASNAAFLVGVAAGQYDEELNIWLSGKKRVINLILVFAFLCTGIFYSFFQNSSVVIYLLGKISASALWAMFLVGFFANEKKYIRLISKLGAASLEIYLIHVFILNRVEILIVSLDAIVVLAIGIFLSIALGLVLHWVFDKISQEVFTVAC